MRIITYRTITEYITSHADVKAALEEWYEKAEENDWSGFADVKKTFNSVDAVGNKRYVFNIKGNSYRLIALILFVPKIVYIRFIGTHAEYDKISDCSKV